MKIRAVFEGILAGVILLICSYSALISPAIVAAIAIQRKMPDAWFSGLIDRFASVAVIGVSMALAGVAGRLVYKHSAGASSPK